MEVRTILRSFWQLINVVRIYGAHALSIILVSYCVGLLASIYGVRGCPGTGQFFNLYLWTFGIVGIAATVVSVFYILFPAVWMQTIDKQIAMSSTDINLPFLSTQPVYVFLDAVFLIPAMAVWQSGRSETMCQFNFEWAFGWCFLLMTIAYPLLRAVSWFALKRKIDAISLVIPWPTLIMWWAFAIPFAIYVTVNYERSQVLPRLRVPVVNRNTFQGGLEKNPQFMAGVVRVQGTLVRGVAKCGLFGKDPKKFPYPSGTVLLDMGKKNGQIMVKANRPSLIELLETEAAGKEGKIFEAFGRLSKLPNLEKRLVCGIGKADDQQKGGLALLEIEMPEQ